MPKRGKSNTIFYHGKNIPKSDSNRTPIRGEPNSFIDFYDKKTGFFHRRRVIGSKGLATRDYDMPDYIEETKHIHDYSESGKRGEGRSPSKTELKHMNKASRKRRFWK